MNSPRLLSLTLGLTAVGITTGKTLAQWGLEPLWSLNPGDRSYLTTGNTERGMAYNPATDHLLVVSRSTTPPTVSILDSTSGSHLGTLDVTGVAGGLFTLNQIDVGSDGAIYAANLVSPSSDSSLFKVYRWASEAAAPAVIYEGQPVVGSRFGDNFAVRGSGADTEIVAGSGSSGSALKTLALLSTADGSAFTMQALPVTDTGVNNGDLRLGISFGAGDTVYANQNNTLRHLSYAGGTPVLLESQTLVSASGTTGAQEAFLPNNLLAALTFSSTAGTVQRVNLYEMATFTPGGTSNPVDSEAFPTSNPNANGAGSVEFSADGERVFVLASNNGVHAYTVVPEPSTLSLLGLGALMLLARRRR